MQLVNGLNEARTAIRAGARALIFPPYAACNAGVGYYLALIQSLRAEFPDSGFTFTVCCGDNPAIAHDALRLGLTSIICECSDGTAAQLTAMAEGVGSVLLRMYPEKIANHDDK